MTASVRDASLGLTPVEAVEPEPARAEMRACCWISYASRCASSAPARCRAVARPGVDERRGPADHRRDRGGRRDDRHGRRARLVRRLAARPLPRRDAPLLAVAPRVPRRRAARVRGLRAHAARHGARRRRAGAGPRRVGRRRSSAASASSPRRARRAASRSTTGRSGGRREQARGRHARARARLPRVRRALGRGARRLGAARSSVSTARGRRRDAPVADRSCPCLAIALWATSPRRVERLQPPAQTRLSGRFATPSPAPTTSASCSRARGSTASACSGTSCTGPGTSSASGQHCARRRRHHRVGARARLLRRLRPHAARAAGGRCRRRRGRADVRARRHRRARSRRRSSRVVVYRLFNFWLPILPALYLMPALSELRRRFRAAEPARG